MSFGLFSAPSPVGEGWEGGYFLNAFLNQSYNIKAIDDLF